LDNTGYVVAGYLITLGALGAYAVSLIKRSRRARDRIEALAKRR
jgi:hypothetical protein